MIQTSEKRTCSKRGRKTSCNSFLNVMQLFSIWIFIAVDFISFQLWHSNKRTIIAAWFSRIKNRLICIAQKRRHFYEVNNSDALTMADGKKCVGMCDVCQCGWTCVSNYTIFIVALWKKWSREGGKGMENWQIAPVDAFEIKLKPPKKTFRYDLK